LQISLTETQTSLADAESARDWSSTLTSLGRNLFDRDRRPARLSCLPYFEQAARQT
jgi:hypothetical protein